MKLDDLQVVGHVVGGRVDSLHRSDDGWLQSARDGNLDVANRGKVLLKPGDVRARQISACEKSLHLGPNEVVHALTARRDLRRHPGIEIDVLSADPQETSRRYGVEATGQFFSAKLGLPASLALVAGLALVQHHMVAKIMFTGSTVTGILK